MKKDSRKIEISAHELNDLKSSIAQSNLKEGDKETVLMLIQLVTMLRALLEKRRIGLLFWLRRIFGLRTEKDGHKTKTKESSRNDDDGGRRGRNGRDDYPGAAKTSVNHPELKPGNQCPECHKGSLQDAEPAVDYHWQGNAPLQLNIYLLQRLICNSCKASFTAPSPVAETAKTVDDSEDEVKVTRCNRNALANAVVASLRYLYGIPHYRLAKIQGRLGIGLP